jgi:hypothetical protein
MITVFTVFFSRMGKKNYGKFIAIIISHKQSLPHANCSATFALVLDNL